MPNQIDCLLEARDHLRSERASLLVQGRALSPEEQERGRRVEEAIAHLDEVIHLLEVPERDGPPEPARRALRDGRYRGGSSDHRIELRIDAEGSSMISADFFSLDAEGESWVASLRTLPDEKVDPEASRFSIVATDQIGSVVTGQLSLVPHASDPSSLSGSLLLDQPATGFPVRTEVAFGARWRSRAMRGLGLEMESQEGLPAPPVFRQGEESITVGSAFAGAGIEVYEVGKPSEVPDPPTPWGTAQLHALMQDHAEASLEGPAFELHLLRLERSSRSGLFGVMFDTTAQLPRQGTAVFEDEIRGRVSDQVERKIIQTTVHELGHGLNLAHRFERQVGRADSTSFMNYDWRYRGGGRREEFWRNFDFTFDDDELTFLRHGPRQAVIPGGHAFHSVRYWNDARGGYTPYYPEVRVSHLELVLSGPVAGRAFDFLQPVLLKVELFNRTGRPLDLPRWWLDPKSGALDVVVRRLGPSSPPADLWVPMMQRCRDMTPSAADIVRNGESLTRNLNLTFGSAGFTFVEPGEYEIRAVIALPREKDEREYIVPSNLLRIRVAAPRNREEEREALVLSRDDVGLYFALGGSRALPRAADDLEEIRKRRHAESPADPIAVNILRCQGIDKGRAYLRKRGDQHDVDQGDREGAARLLQSLSHDALSVFDEETRDTTVALAKKHAAAVGE